MNSDRWKQVDSLLQSALERPPEEREVRTVLSSQQQAPAAGEHSPAPAPLFSQLARSRLYRGTMSRARPPGPKRSRCRSILRRSSGRAFGPITFCSVDEKLPLTSSPLDGVARKP